MVINEVDSLKEVEFTVSKKAKSIFLVPMESFLYKELAKFAKKKKTSVEKALSNIVKRTILWTFAVFRKR